MKTTMTMMGLALLAFHLVACEGAEDDTNPNGGQQPAPSTTTPGGPTTPAPEYLVSCQGGVTKKSVSIGANVGIRCVGGDGSSFCADDPCAAAALEVSYAPPAHRCGSTTVFAWDGKACKGYPTATSEGAMSCKGVGCEKLYKTEAECLAAYQACPR